MQTHNEEEKVVPPRSSTQTFKFPLNFTSPQSTEKTFNKRIRKENEEITATAEDSKVFCEKCGRGVEIHEFDDHAMAHEY